MKKLTLEEWENLLSKETEFFTGRKPGHLSEEQLKAGMDSVREWDKAGRPSCNTEKRNADT